MSSIIRRAAVVSLGVVLLSTPASAHGMAAATTGRPVPLVVAGVVLGNLLSGESLGFGGFFGGHRSLETRATPDIDIFPALKGGVLVSCWIR